jgi:hypothetical protein
MQFTRGAESEYALRVFAGEQTIWYSNRVLVTPGKVYTYQVPLHWFQQTITIAFQSALHFLEPSLTYPAYSAKLRVFQSALSRSSLTEVTVDESGESILAQPRMHCPSGACTVQLQVMGSSAQVLLKFKRSSLVSAPDCHTTCLPPASCRTMQGRSI